MTPSLECDQSLILLLIVSLARPLQPIRAAAAEPSYAAESERVMIPSSCSGSRVALASSCVSLDALVLVVELLSLSMAIFTCVRVVEGENGGLFGDVRKRLEGYEYSFIFSDPSTRPIYFTFRTD
jgi:hypothetical protein